MLQVLVHIGKRNQHTDPCITKVKLPSINRRLFWTKQILKEWKEYAVSCIKPIRNEDILDRKGYKHGRYSYKDEMYVIHLSMGCQRFLISKCFFSICYTNRHVCLLWLSGSFVKCLLQIFLLNIAKLSLNAKVALSEKRQFWSMLYPKVWG